MVKCICDKFEYFITLLRIQGNTLIKSVSFLLSSLYVKGNEFVANDSKEHFFVRPSGRTFYFGEKNGKHGKRLRIAFCKILRG